MVLRDDKTRSLSLFQNKSRIHPLAVKMYLRFPLSLRFVEDLPDERALISATSQSDFGGTGLARRLLRKSEKGGPATASSLIGRGVWAGAGSTTGRRICACRSRDKNVPCEAFDRCELCRSSPQSTSQLTTILIRNVISKAERTSISNAP